MATVRTFLSKFFSIQYLLKPEKQVGELPTSSEMYATFLKLAWPSVVEAVLVGLVGMIDTVMVSTLGDTAIASVGITQQPKLIMFCFCIALGIGTTSVVARRKGQGDRNGANWAMRNTLCIGILMLLVLCSLGFIFAEPFLRLAGAKPDYIEGAIIYFKIIVVSVFFQGVNNLINAAQKGSGNTRISMTTNVISNIVNIIFNYLLINGIGPFPRLEIRGAAIATLMGTVVACTISVSRLLNPKNYISVFCKAPWRLSGEVLRPIFKVSSSALLEQLCMRFGFFVFNRIVADLDTLAYAAHIACQNILSISFFFGDGFQVASTALAGQSLGAQRPDKAYIYCGIGQRVVFFVAIFISVVIIGFRYSIIGLYTKTPEVIALGGGVMLLIALITYVQTAQVIYSGCLRGAGDTKFTARTSLISIAIIRPLAGYLLTYTLGFGLYGAWTSTFLDQLSRLILYYGRIHKRKWLEIKL